MHCICMSSMDRARVLIVDDENAFADVLAELLTDEGYAVVRARNGITAINMLAADHLAPDLIVCDVMMPGLRGDRVASEVRRRFPNRRLPILLLSANSNPKVLLRDVHFLAKPVDVRELLKTVDRMVEPRRRESTAVP